MAKSDSTRSKTNPGLHNVFISSPQFISTLLASINFHFLEAGAELVFGRESIEIRSV
jgi:hypothetical protein